MSRSDRLLGQTNRLAARQPKNLPIETLAASVVSALLAVPSPLSASLTWGGVITLMLAPVAFRTLWGDRRGRWLVITLLSLVPSGLLVAEISLLQDPDRTFNTRFFLYEAALPAGFLAGLTGAYWGIVRLGLQRFLLIFFATLLLVAPLSSPNLHENPWKYGLALPVSILSFLLLARGRLLLGLVIAPILVTVSIAADFRTWIALLAPATLLAVAAPIRLSRPSASKVARLGFITMTSGAVASWLVIEAASSGLLGTYLENRTRVQLDAANGNLLLGGRPEWAAAMALWREYPLGLGIGVAPSRADYWLAIQSMPLNSLAQQELSGVAADFRMGLTSFHSTLWTFWGIYGPAGFLCAALALIFAAKATLVGPSVLSNINLRASVTLLMLACVWDILFSPPVVSQLAVALAAALHLLASPNPTKDSTSAKKPPDQHHHDHVKRSCRPSVHGSDRRSPNL